MEEKRKAFPLRLYEDDYERLERVAKELRTPIHKVVVQAIMIHLTQMEKTLGIRGDSDQ